MSTQVANTPFKAYLGNEELMLERQRAQSRLKQSKDRNRKVAIESSHSRYFTDGVRAPLLSDINFGQSCCLDVVRPAAKKLHSNGTTSPESPGRKTAIPHIPLEKENSNVVFSERSSNTIRSIRFLLPDGSLRSHDESAMSSRSASELDLRWKRSKNSPKLDARDILYRNTYCGSPDLRYHSITLPSIACQNKTAVPRASKTKTTSPKKKITFKDNEHMPEKFQEHCVLDSKLEKQKNIQTTVDIGFLKVQKIKSHLEEIHSGNDEFLLTVRQPTDLHNRNSNHPMELRTERPLKYETVGPHGSRLHRKHSTLRTVFPYFNKEYKSADAYKEYLEMVKSKMELSSRESTRIGNDSVLSHFGRDNRVLQSVIDVNTPTDRHGALSNDGRSLVIEIKPTWNEIPNGLLDEEESDDFRPDKCPVNTPDHE